MIYRQVRVILLSCVFSLFGCRPDHATQPDKEIGLAALKDYCLGERLTIDDFDHARIYADSKYDVCVEYTTKPSVVPRHVLLLFFKDGRIVERQRDIQEDPALK